MTYKKHFITSEPTIVPNKEHCDVFINGTFYCSCDNIKEAQAEINRLKQESPVSI